MAHNKLRREITAYMEGGPSSTAGMLTTAHQLLMRAFEALGGPVGDTRTEKSRDLAQGYGMSAERAAIQFPVGRIDVEEEAGPASTMRPWAIGDVVCVDHLDFQQRIIAIDGSVVEVGFHSPGSITDGSAPYRVHMKHLSLVEPPHPPTETEWQDIGRPSHGLGASESE